MYNHLKGKVTHQFLAPNYIEWSPIPQKIVNYPLMVESWPQLNGTVVQKVEVTPNKIENALKRFSPPKKWKIPPKLIHIHQI